MNDSILSRADEVRAFILEHVDGHESDIPSFAAEHFGVTRQAIHIHIQALEKEGSLVSTGRTRGKIYKRPQTDVTLATDGLSEHDLYQDYVDPILVGLSDNVLSICEYGITEMVNNVIDHSGSSFVKVMTKRTQARVKLTVVDWGVGIFRKIQRDCDLEDMRLAVFELTKGKLTTDPSRHTGEGVFFTSRMFDRFSIWSYEMYLGHSRDGDDWLFNDPDDTKVAEGTMISMEIDPASTHTRAEVFDKYSAEQDDYAFSKTHVVVKLADMGEASFVSRSQAKRIVSRLEEFREVVVDFEGVAEIGPAFSDEIFRVFASQHPSTHLLPVSMNEQTTKMVSRALSHGSNG